MAFDSAGGRVVLFGGTDGLVRADTWQYPGCPAFVDASVYGRLLFPPVCTQPASVLPQNPYNSTSFTMSRAASDRIFLSSTGGTPTSPGLGTSFSPLLVDEAIHINGAIALQGPYSPQPGITSPSLDAPIESNYVPIPSHEVTSLIPTGQSSVSFELYADSTVSGNVYGNTAVYLVRDCGIWLAGNNPIEINWIAYDDHVPIPRMPEFQVRTGLLSQLRADRHFGGATCLGHYFDTPATVMLSQDPPTGDGYYFLAKGISSTNCNSYGDSTLDAMPACSP